MLTITIQSSNRYKQIFSQENAREIRNHLPLKSATTFPQDPSNAILPPVRSALRPCTKSLAASLQPPPLLCPSPLPPEAGVLRNPAGTKRRRDPRSKDLLVESLELSYLNVKGRTSPSSIPLLPCTAFSRRFCRPAKAIFAAGSLPKIRDAVVTVNSPLHSYG